MRRGVAEVEAAEPPEFHAAGAHFGRPQPPESKLEHYQFFRSRCGKPPIR